MVEYDAVQQSFYNFSAKGAVTLEDVMAIVGDEATDSNISERFAGIDLLPDYRNLCRRDIFQWNSLGKLKAADYRRCTAALDVLPSEEEDRAKCLAVMRELAKAAFSLADLLRNPTEHPPAEADLSNYGATVLPAESGKPGLVDFETTFEIPPCSYLQFASDGCEKLAARPLYCDCAVLPIDPQDEKDPFVGWLANRSGCVLTFAVRDLTPDCSGRVRFLELLLKFLLDLHLHDVQLVTYDRGKQALAAKHAVAMVWSCLRESIDGGRPGTCRVCGKPFVATNERKNKARYCEPNGKCIRAFARTKKVLSYVDAGEPVESALEKVGGMSRHRLADIARRNYYILSLEFENVDFEELTAEGGDA